MTKRLKRSQGIADQYQQMLDRSGGNLVMSPVNLEFCFVSPDLPILIKPFIAYCHIEVYCCTGGKLDNFEQLQAKVEKAISVRASLEKLGYSCDGTKAMRDGSDIYCQFVVDTPTMKDLEKVVRDCASLRI